MISKEMTPLSEKEAKIISMSENVEHFSQLINKSLLTPELTFSLYSKAKVTKMIKEGKQKEAYDFVSQKLGFSFNKTFKEGGETKAWIFGWKKQIFLVYVNAKGLDFFALTQKKYDIDYFSENMMDLFYLLFEA